jgi:hypothetical protein
MGAAFRFWKSLAAPEKSSQHPTQGNRRTKKEHPAMKKKTAKQPKSSKTVTRLKDLKPSKDVKGASFLGGIGKVIGGVIKIVPPTVPK